MRNKQIRKIGTTENSLLVMPKCPHHFWKVPEKKAENFASTFFLGISLGREAKRKISVE
jgi:hypothetical protein